VDALCLAPAQAELIAAQLVDAGVAKGGAAKHEDGSARNEAEIEQPIPHGISGANVRDEASAAHGQRGEGGSCRVEVGSSVVHENENRFHE
jgi:hypothetical protein